ncbi:MAG: hypothetical protein HY763_16990 [Planctomycetes bacterium]|nr:hypothetical protein [Planctomycetota bacterium]
MSLKAFHIVFVVVCSLLALGMGVWAIRDYRGGGDKLSLVIGVGSFLGFVGLLVYGRWFLRKLRGVSYL